MAAEANTEEIENFALVEIGGRPHAGDAVDRGIALLNQHREANALVQRVRKNVIGNSESAVALGYQSTQVTSTRKL